MQHTSNFDSGYSDSALPPGGTPRFRWGAIGQMAVWLALPWLYLMGVWWAFDRTLVPGSQLLGQLLWVAHVPALAVLPRLAQPRQRAFVWRLLVAVWILGQIAYGMSQQTDYAWLLLGASYALLLAVDQWLAQGRGWVVRALLHTVTVGGGALWAITLTQLETGFADEEFFVAVQMLVLMGLVALLLLASYRLVSLGARLLGRTIAAPRAAPVPLGIGLGWGTLLAGVGSALLVWTYAGSFYPPTAPAYPGIDAASPFLCATLADAPDASYASDQFFQDYLAQVEVNPYKGPPELAMLALGMGDADWAAAFRGELLAEAAAGRFTEAAHSIKSVQHGAAQRIYYTAAMRQTFPELFSPADMVVLEAWFAAINRRALTIEWVDWMYAVAFWKAPEGPYENQESGAGLLAMLEWTGWADPAAHAQNLDYLARNSRGWQQRFRNTDDAYIYQLEWLTNAWFQTVYRDSAQVASGNNAAPADEAANLRHAYDWLALQMLPNGAAPYYNHVAHPALGSALARGAQLLEDEQLLWLAGHSLTQSRAQERLHYAQPGLEAAPPLTPQPPDTGSCLLYGDSGVPNQQGPLAPDKIVFRDGWDATANYLMLNLRFSGWHRYKATNGVVFVYADGLQVADAVNRNPYAWLPQGRSLFRDKRVPRENLSGLLIPNSGMSALLYWFTAVGSPWAQDPPVYAKVLDFATGVERDYSHTRLENWRGWTHDREVHFIHGGPVALVDYATGPPNQTAALSWHLPGAEDMTEPHASTLASTPARVNLTRLTLAGDTGPVEVVFVPLGEDAEADSVMLRVLASPEGTHEARYTAPTGGALAVATVFLRGEWYGATVAPVAVDGSPILRVTGAAGQVDISLASPSP